MAQNYDRTGPGPNWSLRVILGLCVTALVIAGFQLRSDPPSHAATSTTATTTNHSTTSIATSGSTTTIPTTTTPPSETIAPLPSPVINDAAFAEPGRGCHFNTGAPSPTGSTTPPHITPTVSGRCTVLEIGDSLGNDLGWGIARQLGNDHVLRLVQADKSSTGLTTSWFYNWPVKESVLLAQYKPQLVIITFGGNDEQNLKVDGHVVAFASAPWITAYTKIVTKIATIATTAGAYVLWAGMPIMEPNGYRQGMEVINSVFQKVAEAVPGMAFLPAWDLFANAKGQYENDALVNRVPQILRASDGIHFSYVGENVFATYVVHELAIVYHVQVAPDAAMFIDR